ncbi:PAP17 [Scenedesmus sp. PABB004]|nr:PAP17 [Scenedesmus sp. PABB004]
MDRAGSADWGGGGFGSLHVVGSFAFLAGARYLYQIYNRPADEGAYAYVPWEDGALPPDDTVVVDCTHPRLPTLSHHRGAANPAGLRPADTSTGLVLNALQHRAGPWLARDVAGITQRRCVTVNHFDVDAFLSVWAYINRAAALEHEGVLRHMARIGDFREAFLSPDLITAHGAGDRVTFIREAYTALKLVCWLNTLEARLFSAPYEAKDAAPKMAWFLERFERVLRDPESAWGDWQAEYTRVVSGFDLLAGADCMVEAPPGLGLAVLSAPEPLHYVSLFSHTVGQDVVLMMYDDNRYEVECKYTQFVVLASRPTWPRLDMAPLAAVLNRFECAYAAGGPDAAADAAAAAAGGESEMQWVASSFTDTGPLLRLERRGETLSKAARYGSPCDRPIHSSAIPPRRMQAIVQSFLGFGLQGLKPKLGGWSWQELQELNQQIHWQDWASCVLEQVSRGDLDQLGATGMAAAQRRRSLPAGYPLASSGGAARGAAGAAPGAGAPAALPAAEQPGGGEVELPELAAGPSFAGGKGFTSPANIRAPGAALPAGGAPPVLSQPSVVAQPAALAALAAALPPLHRGTPWLLIYSTARDGTSLATLLRKAERVAPSLLLVRDGGGGVFGAFVAEAWRAAPRFYGTGESFVFQLAPAQHSWGWVNAPGLRNDFFQYASHEGLGVGGAAPPASPAPVSAVMADPRSRHAGAPLALALAAAALLLLAAAPARAQGAAPAAAAPPLACARIAEAFTRYQLDYAGFKPAPGGAVRHNFNIMKNNDDYVCDAKGSDKSKNKCCHSENAVRAIELTLLPPCAAAAAAGRVAVLLDGARLAANQFAVDAGTLTVFAGPGLGGPEPPSTVALEFAKPASPGAPDAACSTGLATQGFGPCPAATGCAFSLLISPAPLDGPRGRCGSAGCAEACCDVHGNTQTTEAIASTSAFKCGAPARGVPGPKGLSTEVDTSDFPVRFLVIGDWGANSKPTPSGDANPDRRAQQLVAAAMAQTADCFKPQFIANMGDNFYDNGLRSVNDTHKKAQWADVYGRFPSLANLTWYGVLGNHDYNKYYEPLPKECLTDSWAACQTMACCYSPRWLYTEHFGDPRWVTSNGSYVVSKGDGLVDLVMFDSNPFMPHYLKNPKDLLPWLPGGLREQNATATAEAVKRQLSSSDAVWRLVVSHHTFESMGHRCYPSYKECRPMEGLKRFLWQQNIPLAMNGHDHSQQLVKNGSGPTFFLTTGAGGRVTDAVVENAKVLWPNGPLYTSSGSAFIADNGFATVAASRDRLVLKIYTIGKNGPQQGLAYQLVLNAKDFRKPGGTTKPAATTPAAPKPAAAPKTAAAKP